MRTARMELRSTSDQKEIIETAADLRGVTVSAFILSIVLKNAKQIIAEHQVTDLSIQDWKLFSEIIDRSTQPNAALEEAVTAHKEQIELSEGL